MSPGGLEFAKLEALGNDFVVIEVASDSAIPEPAAMRRLADRRRGIGCDQLLVVLPAAGTAAARVRIFNADASAAEQCGNGMRALAAWLDHGGRLAEVAELETPAGPVTVARRAGGDYAADLPGPARIEPAALALQPPSIFDAALGWQLVTVGNPHLLIETAADPDAAALARAVERVEAVPAWRNRVNIGLVRRNTPEALQLRVHERGAGPTPACGSAAIAAALLAGSRGEVSVDQPGGRLVIDLHATTGRAATHGPARVVFKGYMA